jgi:hypothetical protein
MPSETISRPLKRLKQTLEQIAASYLADSSEDRAMSSAAPAVEGVLIIVA